MVFSALLDKGKRLTQHGKRRYQAGTSKLHKPTHNSSSTPPHSSFPATKCHGDISLFVVICSLQTVTGSFCLFHQSFSCHRSTYLSHPLLSSDRSRHVALSVSINISSAPNVLQIRSRSACLGYPPIIKA